MEKQTSFSVGNYIKLSDKALEELLLPISNGVLIDRVALYKGLKTKKIPFKEGQSKRDYLYENLGKNFTLEVLRDLRINREHALISDYSWQIFTWDKSLSRYFPDKFDKKLKESIFDVGSVVNIDFLIVDEPQQTFFLLLEQWQNEVVADTFLSRVETNIPIYSRIYISLVKKMILIQQKSQKNTADFLLLFEKTFGVKTVEITINAMMIREFVKTSTEKITRLVVKVPQEVAGFGGLTEFTFYGADVLSGIKGLLVRHETSPIDVGPWTGVSNAFLDVDAGKAIRTKSIQQATWFFTLVINL